jgi:hypothetical protein
MGYAQVPTTIYCLYDTIITTSKYEDTRDTFYPLVLNIIWIISIITGIISVGVIFVWHNKRRLEIDKKLLDKP